MVKLDQICKLVRVIIGKNGNKLIKPFWRAENAEENKQVINGSWVENNFYRKKFQKL